MRISPKFTLVFLLAALGMWLLAGYVQSKDSALAGVQVFLARTEEVTRITGAQPSITVHNSVFYQGAPSKEDTYREYRITANGSQGTVDLTVRALKSGTQGSWSYQVKAINK